MRAVLIAGFAFLLFGPGICEAKAQFSSSERPSPRPVFFPNFNPLVAAPKVDADLSPSPTEKAPEVKKESTKPASVERSTIGGWVGEHPVWTGVVAVLFLVMLTCLVRE